MIKIKVETLFDITATGVTGHFKSARVPFTDRAGNKIVDDISWHRSRNQQRNFETLTQIISLRTQIDNLTRPQVNDDMWTFEFTSEVNVFTDGTDPVAILKQDAEGVPMLRELNNDPDIEPVLVIDGARQNVWFSSEAINNILEN